MFIVYFHTRMRIFWLATKSKAKSLFLFWAPKR